MGYVHKSIVALCWVLFKDFFTLTGTFVTLHKMGCELLGTLYENIKALCDESGIRPGKMCVEAKVSKGLITDLKMGRKKTVQIATAQKIADYFGVSVDRVMSGEKKEIQANDDMDLTSEELEFIRWYRSEASEKDKALIKTIIEND